MTAALSTRRHRLWAVPRSRGAVSGLLLLLLGVWGALVPFVGPAVHYGYTPDRPWTYTNARLLLEVAPGVVCAVGGLLVLLARHRIPALIGGALAVAAGGWFIVGPLLAPLVRAGSVGTPVGGSTAMAVEKIGYFFGLGGAIVLVAGFVLGRFSVVSVRDGELIEAPAERVEPVAGRSLGTQGAAGGTGREERDLAAEGHGAGAGVGVGAAPGSSRGGLLSRMGAGRAPRRGHAGGGSAAGPIR